ncbi:MAG: FAD-dependent oxidoreductase [Xenococcaceae cyanobacterium MO_207.B15]|nr:FAD-dependent oxidoreductase [Xenococcaceae cyanobacterium MO_207.B15]
MPKPDSVLIIGAGIFGLTTSIELRKRGYQVTVLERGAIPNPLASSFDRCKVIRPDYGADEFYVEMMETAFSGWDSWNREWPIPPYDEVGLLLLSKGEMKTGDFEYESFHLLRNRGYSLVRLQEPQLQERFNWSRNKNYVDGYFNPRSGYADCMVVNRQLYEMSLSLGVNFQENTQVDSLLKNKSRVLGVVTQKGNLEADYVVIASGAWSAKLFPQYKLPIQVVGQPVFYFKPSNKSLFESPSFCVWGADISHSGWYGFPALSDGTVKVANHGLGLPLEPDGNRELSVEQIRSCREFLAEIFPELASAKLSRKHLCLYSDTLDGDFLIDYVPDLEGIILATGGSGHAFKFAPILGTCVADVLEGRTNIFTSRFKWRDISL